MDKKFLNSEINKMIMKKYAKPLTAEGRIKDKARNPETKPDILDLAPMAILDIAELLGIEDKGKGNYKHDYKKYRK